MLTATIEVSDFMLDLEAQLKALEGIIYNNPSPIFFDIVLLKYYPDDVKKLTLCKWNATKDLRTFLRVLYKEKVVLKNLKKDENVYVAITEKTKFLNFIWLDDLKPNNLTEEQKKYITLIETSNGNCQGWIKLNKTYSEEEIKKIKKYLVNTLNADRSPLGKIHPARLPGFFSFKHEEPFYCKVINKATKTLNGFLLVKNAKEEDYKSDFDKKFDVKKIRISGLPFTMQTIHKKEISYSKKELKNKMSDKDFHCFFRDIDFNPLEEYKAIQLYITKREIDYNRVDIHYVYQLIIRGYTAEEVYNYLLTVRPDLPEKHRNVEEYFVRTYLKAFISYSLCEKCRFYKNSAVKEELEKQKNTRVIDFLLSKVN